MSSATSQAEKLSLWTSTQPCFRFSLGEIQSATKDFDDKLVIGEGGFGKVYKGSICIEEISHVVAIKRLDSMSNQGAPEFRAEIQMLSKLRHCHLVSLIGYCDDDKEMVLVYAYMPHGTLYYHLHKAETPLSWMQRLKIAIGAGRGLDYLHTGVGTQHGVIHRDVKSSNILLDENWEAMISDFGLSKVGTTNQSSSYVGTSVSVKGTFGYLDPEYFLTRKVTRETDVYAFGVVLFELLSGRLAVDERNAEDQCSLVRWAQRCVKERKLDQMVDSNIRGTIFPKCLRGFAKIAERCLRSIIKERPTMAEVVVSLQALLEQQQRHNSAAEPSGLIGFSWRIHKYLVFAIKQNPDQIGKSSSKSLEKNMSQGSSANKDAGSEHNEMPREDGKLAVNNLKWFSYDELRCATNDFGKSTCLSDKAHAKVHKGWIDKTTYSPSNDNTGLPVAIKGRQLYRNVDQFDLEKLKEFSHPNIEKLIGYCLQHQRILLVYEFMANGNLEDLLHKGSVAHFPWVTRVNIAVGIARGITFLYKTVDQDGILGSCRIERHKILLAEDFTAKLSNYQYPSSCVYPDINYYHPEYVPFQPHWDPVGFTVVFAEVLMGRHFSNLYNLKKINHLLKRLGKKSFVHLAYVCLEICNEVNSESKMLRILEEYEQYIGARN